MQTPANTERPAWLVRAQQADAPYTTPRPQPAVFVRAARAAAAAWELHQTRCVRCGTNPLTSCERGAALARRAGDAQQAAEGARQAAR